jgi:hypothetical protein
MDAQSSHSVLQKGVNMNFDFEDISWRLFPRKTREKLNLASNELRWNEATKSGALIAGQGSKYDAYLVSKTGLDYLSDAVRHGKIPDGIVVLPKNEGPRRLPEKVMPLAEVLATVEGVEPRHGPYGPYFLLRPDGTSYDLDEAPF